MDFSDDPQPALAIILGMSITVVFLFAVFWALVIREPPQRLEEGAMGHRLRSQNLNTRQKAMLVCQSPPCWCLVSSVLELVLLCGSLWRSFKVRQPREAADLSILLPLIAAYGIDGVAKVSHD